MQPMLGNETILSAISTLPNSIQLLKSMAQILTRPEIKSLFGTYARVARHLIYHLAEEFTSSIEFVKLDRGIRLGDLFNNHEEIKDHLRLQMPYARSELIDQLFNSSIKLLYVSIVI